MAGFRTIGDIIDSTLNGNTRDYLWRKTPSQVTSLGIWFDLSMSPGNPPPKYWFDAAPLTAKGIYQSQDGGLYHGPNVSPSTKYLRKLSLQGVSTSSNNVTPMSMVLCDYLLYYPTIDDGTTDEQVMTNTVTLPRYTDGVGVSMIAVTTGLRVGGQTFTVKYTNSDGVSGRVSQVVTQNAAAYIGAITTSERAVNNGAGWEIPLQSGDIGVRLVESVTMGGVDIGLFTIILIKPLAHITLREIVTSTAGTLAVPYEKDFLIPTSGLPIIYDDAFLNYLTLPMSNISNTMLMGSINTVWN